MLSRSISGMEKCFKTSGKAGAIKYCNDWKNELAAAVKELDSAKNRGMDVKTYNQKKVVLNNITKELNACISAMNKLS